VLVPTYRGRAAGLALGCFADALFGDPRRGHPVALFGSAAMRLERFVYADRRGAGVAYTGLLVGTVLAATVAADRAAARRGPAWTAGLTALCTFTSLGGTSLARTGAQMSARLDATDVAGARALLPSLCGRDPASLDVSGLTRAALESIAENTSDAAVAPLLWGMVAGAPGLLAYRAANTLDAMVGYRSARYERFGWAAARFDDVLNYLPARLSGLLVAACAMTVDGSASVALDAWRRDARRHPSPNAGVVEASFAGALGVRLGGPTQYAHRLEIRPTLGDGRTPSVPDLGRAVRLSRAVQVGAAAVCTAGALGLSGVGRTGRRASDRV
jgi:adenosylcobinamide-phosphate synthase